MILKVIYKGGGILSKLKSIETNYILLLLLMVPISILLDIIKANSITILITAGLSIIPLAAVLGDATEQISIYTGPKIGGIVNATMGNIPELFIGIFSLKAGMFSLVKASIVGSIIGNMLLVLGFSILFGGIKYKFQQFDKLIARTNFGLMFLALIGFVIPVAYNYIGNNNSSGLKYLSFGIALVFLVIYLLGLVFSLYTHRNLFLKSEDNISDEHIKWSLGKSIVYLIIAAVILAYESEILVDSISVLKGLFGLSEIFIGIVIVPVLGNVAEYTSAMLMALKDRINLSIEIAIGSGMQMALFVGPLLVLISYILGYPMTYVLTSFELVTIICAIGLSLFIFQDGKTNWLEGIELLSAYIIIALAYFFL